MRNGNIGDVLALGLGKDLSNVVFLVDHPTFGKVKAHPIKNGQWIENDGRIRHVMETMSGEKFIAKLSWVGPVPRKLGTPPKLKRKPQKGTKPELANAVPYDPALLTDGCNVLTACGNIFVVDFTNSLGDEYYYLRSIDLQTGKNKYSNIWNIKKIILDKPVAKQPDTPKYEKGVWYFWEGKSSCPPVADDVIVEYWLRDNCCSCMDKQPAGRLMWRWQSKNYDIIAFRIVD